MPERSCRSLDLVDTTPHSKEAPSAEQGVPPACPASKPEGEAIHITRQPAFPVRLTAVTELPPDDSYVPVVAVGSGGTVNIGCPGFPSALHGRAPRESPEGLVLAETSTNKIDLDQIVADFPELGPTLAPIMDVRAFEALFIDPITPDPRRPLSRGMSVHTEDLVKYDILDVAPNSLHLASLLLVVWCTLFLVPKKIAPYARLVIDARPINRRQRRPPPMGLPRIHDVIRQILSYDVAAKCDGKSFFYQFPLVPEVGAYFRTRLAGRRGQVVSAVLKRLAMGWSYSPGIAQAVGNMLTRALGLAWVDDFIIGGTWKTFDSVRTEFRERLRRYNVEVDDLELTPQEQLHALGLHFDLVGKRFRVDPAWIEKRQKRWHELLTKMDSEQATFREIFELMGSLIWADYVCDIPLWMRAECLAALRTTAKQVQGQYDSPCVWPTYARKPMHAWVREVEENAWHQPKAKPAANATHDILFSDASSTGGAWIRVFNGIITAGDQWMYSEDMHIFLREVEAMCAAARACPQRPGEPRIQAVDNTAAVATGNNGLSSSYAANVMCRQAYGRHKPNVVWVPTHKELADPYTRGEKIPALPTPISRPQAEVIASL